MALPIWLKKENGKLKIRKTKKSNKKYGANKLIKTKI